MPWSWRRRKRFHIWECAKFGWHTSNNFSCQNPSGRLLSWTNAHGSCLFGCVPIYGKNAWVVDSVPNLTKSVILSFCCQDKKPVATNRWSSNLIRCFGAVTRMNHQVVSAFSVCLWKHHNSLIHTQERNNFLFFFPLHNSNTNLSMLNKNVFIHWNDRFPWHK